MCSMASCGDCGMCSRAWESAPFDFAPCEFSGHRFDDDGICIDCGEPLPPALATDDKDDDDGCEFCGRSDCAGDCPQRYEAMEDEIFDQEVCQ